MKVTDTISGAFLDFSFTLQIYKCGSKPSFQWDAGNSAVTGVSMLGVGATLEGPVFALAENGDCPLLHTLSLFGYATPPSIFTFDSATNVLSVKPTLPTEVGSYKIIITATVANGSSNPPSKTTSFTLQIVFPTLAVITSTDYSS